MPPWGRGEEKRSEEEYMNEVFENIYLRRSVRDYKPDDLPDDIIREVIRAGTYAPYVMSQPWRFVVIKNKEMISRLSDRAKKLWLDTLDKSSAPEIEGLGDIERENVKKIMGTPEFNIFYNAPVLILLFAAPTGHSHQDVCAAAAENMMLAARSLDIGSCWIGFGMPLGYDQDTLAGLKVPEGYRLMVPLVFGYPVKDIQTAPPRDEDVVFNWIT